MSQEMETQKEVELAGPPAPQIKKIDLRKHITSVFENHGQADPAAWLKYLSATEVTEIERGIETGDIGYQRFVINRFFRNLFGKLTLDKGVNTYDARWCLFDQDTIENWISHFNGAPAKCVIANSLCGMQSNEVSEASQ